MLSLTALVRLSPAYGEDTVALGPDQRMPDVRSSSHESHIYSFVIPSKPHHC